jgi:hypothetical protein
MTLERLEPLRCVPDDPPEGSHSPRPAHHKSLLLTIPSHLPARSAGPGALRPVRQASYDTGQNEPSLRGGLPHIPNQVEGRS